MRMKIFQVFLGMMNLSRKTRKIKINITSNKKISLVWKKDLHLYSYQLGKQNKCPWPRIKKINQNNKENETNNKLFLIARMDL